MATDMLAFMPDNVDLTKAGVGGKYCFTLSGGFKLQPQLHSVTGAALRK